MTTATLIPYIGSTVSYGYTDHQPKIINNPVAFSRNQIRNATRTKLLEMLLNQYENEDLY